MYVLHISNDYYYSSLYRNLHKNLLCQGVESVMIVPSNKNEFDRPKEENVIQIKCFYGIDRFFYFIKQNKILHAIKAYVCKFEPEILHSHFVFSGGYACMKIKQKFGIPYIVAVRNTDVNLFFRKMIHLRRVGIKILINADKIIFLNPSYRDMVINQYIPKKYRNSVYKKSIIIPNGIDEFWHSNIVLENKKHNGKKINIITVGAINKNKNQLTVAKAIQILNKIGYQTTYTVVGKIEDDNIYSELIKHDFVKHIKNQPKEKLLQYYREADIFVMPSITETFGLVYPEAMSQGLPVIYSRGQGFDGQFNDGVVGYSVNSLDEKEISNQIIEILKKYDSISEACVVNSGKFKWKIISNEYSKIYNVMKS